MFQHSGAYYTRGFDGTVGTPPIMGYICIIFLAYISIRVWWELYKERKRVKDRNLKYPFAANYKP
jgi:hypothetical protein